MQVSSKFKSSHRLQYRFGYIRNGKRVLLTPWRSNLILDSGLDKMAGVYTQECWGFCLFGDQVAPTPVERSSGAITFTVASMACTASGSFFLPSDVGRLIKFDDVSGQEFYITAYTSNVLVTLSAVPATPISLETGKIWYVNQTALESFYSATNNYGLNGGDNSTSILDNVITCQRTFIGAAVGGTVTLTEIGFSNTGSNSNIFDRDIITGGVTLLLGDQPLAIAQLITSYDPHVLQTPGNIATGFDSSGEIIISALDYTTGGVISIVNSNGSTGSNLTCSLEPSFATPIVPILGSFSMPSFTNNTSGPNYGFNAPTSNNLASYVNGTFKRNCTSAFGLSIVNGTIYGIYWAYSLGGAALAAVTQKFTTPFVKTNAQTLSLTVEKSWQRILFN